MAKRDWHNMAVPKIEMQGIVKSFGSKHVLKE